MPTTTTKDRILDAAEKLFAEMGFAATSLRTITSEAGVNLAAVNYHFGSKEALLSALFERRLGPINRERLALLDGIERAAAGRTPQLEAILGALLKPPFRSMRTWGASGARFMQLAGRMHTEANEQLRDSFLRQFEEVFGRFSAALQRALPHLSLETLRWRMHFVIGAMAHTLAWTGTGGCVPYGLHSGSDTEAVVESLISFAAAGLRAGAPVPPAAGAVREP